MQKPLNAILIISFYRLCHYHFFCFGTHMMQAMDIHIWRKWLIIVCHNLSSRRHHLSSHGCHMISYGRNLLCCSCHSSTNGHNSSIINLQPLIDILLLLHIISCPPLIIWWPLLIFLGRQLTNLQIAIRWLSQDLTDDKSTLVRVMDWRKEYVKRFRYM